MIEETDRIHTRTSHRFERRRKEKEGYIKKIKSYNNHTKQIDGERKREKKKSDSTVSLISGGQSKAV